ncbi:MAG: hypothetical protein CW345_05655 [Firmicutes bacterium]|nr:hypothetical protein [Bacillota bacterium]MBO2521272.1 hypothetical protein [Bacillota bacterium]
MSSRYSVAQRVDRGEQVVELIDAGTKSSATIVPTVGANCNRYVWEHQGQPLELLVSAPDYDALREGPYLYGNPILFPYPNRVRDGRFAFGGKQAALPINEPERNNAIHGLVYNRPWEVVSQGASDEEGAWVTLRFASSAHPEVEAAFPFPFEVLFTYRLKDGALANEMTAKNTGSGPMPMGYGLHPWFPLPLSPKGRRSQCRVKAPVTGVWELDARLLPTGEIRQPAPARDLSRDVPLADEEYDDVYTGLNQHGPSEVVYADPGTGVEIAVRSDSAFREFVIYAPLSRDVICLEPYTCVTDAFNLAARGVDAGMIVLEPGQSWTGNIVYIPRPVSG